MCDKKNKTSKNLFTLFLISFLLISCSKGSDLNKGDIEFKNGNYEKALNYYLKTLKSAESDIIYYKLAQTSLKLKKNIQADSFVKKGLNIEPEKESLLLLNAQIASERRVFSEAIFSYNKIMKLYGEKDEYKFEIARNYLLYKNVKDGFEVIKKLTLTKEQKEIITEILLTYPLDYACFEKESFLKEYYNETKTTKALRDYYNAVKCTKNLEIQESLIETLVEKEKTIESYNEAALFYIEKENLEKAEEYIFKSESIKMEQSETEYLRGEISFFKGKFENAILFYEKALKNPNFKIKNQIHLAEAYYFSNQFKKAEPILNELLKNSKNYSLTAAIYLRNIYEKLENPEKIKEIDFFIKWIHKSNKN
ncbi:hypothetical protein JXR93_06800 [bacterium]|nr:hypothetical protein [bacterium]